MACGSVSVFFQNLADTGRQKLGFSGARACDDHDRAFDALDSTALFVVEFFDRFLKIGQNLRGLLAQRKRGTAFFFLSVRIGFVLAGLANSGFLQGFGARNRDVF